MSVEYSVLAFRARAHLDAGKIESAANAYAAAGWRVISVVMTLSWWIWTTQVLVVLERETTP
jgi:hypothetical protein